MLKLKSSLESSPRKWCPVASPLLTSALLELVLKLENTTPLVQEMPTPRLPRMWTAARTRSLRWTWPRWWSTRGGTRTTTCRLCWRTPWWKACPSRWSSTSSVDLARWSCQEERHAGTMETFWMAIVLLVKPKISKMEFRGNSILHCLLEHVYCFFEGHWGVQLSTWKLLHPSVW